MSENISKELDKASCVLTTMACKAAALERQNDAMWAIIADECNAISCNDCRHLVDHTAADGYLSCDCAGNPACCPRVYAAAMKGKHTT